MPAATISAVLFYITQDRDILERLTQEVRSSFADAVPTIGPRLESCKYLRACVDEALRMAPPGLGVFWRTSPTDIVIDGVRLPAGTDFGVNCLGYHFDSDIFPDPCVFRPERFLDGNAREMFIPFLRGFRSCPAQKHAYATILLPVARLVWDFNLSAVGSQSRQRGSLDIAKVYEQTFGSTLQPELERNGSGSTKELYFQVDKFGSSVEGPVLRCQSRVD